MDVIVGNAVVRAKKVNTSMGKKNVMCLYRKIDGKGCSGCPFLQVNNLCARPPRNNPSAVLIEGAH